MLNVDQFVYTTATLSGKSGYQIIAKSSGITEEMVSTLDPYLYPIGIIPSKFKESKSFLVLKKSKKIAFSKIRNIGIGHDGRSNTLYNHTLVMDLDDFRQIDCDTRILESFYFEDYNIQGSLPQLKIEPQRTTFYLGGIEGLESVLQEILSALFDKEKIAIVGSENSELIQKLLGIIPPSMRLISFSTLVNDIDKQPDYDLIITSKSTSNKDYYKIDMEHPQAYLFKQRIFEESINFLTEIILSKKINKIQEFFDQFENITGNDYKNKLILLAYLNKIESTSDKSTQQDFSYVLLDYLKKFDIPLSYKIFDKIKQHLHLADIVRHAPEFEIPKILSDFENLPIEKETIEKMLSKLSNRTSESRAQLLHELLQKHKKEFSEKGSQILIDSRYSYYRSDIYQLFVDNELLFNSIFNIFDIQNDLDVYYKKVIYETIFNIASKTNPQLLLSLLDCNVFDLSEKYGVSDFRNLIKESFQFTAVKNSNVDLILALSNKIFNKITTIIKLKKSSDLKTLTNSTLKQLIKLANVVEELLRYTHQNRELTNVQKNELLQLINEIHDFIDKNDSENYW